MSHECTAERNGVRRVLGCPSHETHPEHDWYDRKSGLVVHCYGWTAGKEA